ncbi:unnamed protein product (macronuclear) [Paramecium tetraurelia]|uniref:Uncharacterized protein n=1 Tax=Paramecium tetraurelia TaxID=5888 RepID=A0BL49_PARTE|nr:uncharacterized protein GSPATT00029897001 [Paramecium tetraurelia]CAK59266.1 unnamed protein product [Paramecium tetraurelia]|eukprot:XP_001426664.1 hypothetical protein (macronuclear) [Paramecium tetraurelia strain d4-2]
MNQSEVNEEHSPHNSEHASQNISQFLQRDYYEKFKLGQNLYEQSITLSRLSLGEKTSEDYNNNTYVGLIQIQERLSDEICKNQLLESKVTQLTKDLQSAMEHTALLQKQNENYVQMLQEANTKLQKQIRNNEIEKVLNQQLMKKNQELLEVNNNYQKQVQNLEKKKQIQNFSDCKNITLTKCHQKSNQSICSSNRNKEKQNQGNTEESTVKDSSLSDFRSNDNPRFAESAQQFYKSQNFWSPAKQSSPKAQPLNLEKRIESTLAQIRAIKMQIQQLNQK